MGEPKIESNAGLSLICLFHDDTKDARQVLEHVETVVTEKIRKRVPENRPYQREFAEMSNMNEKGGRSHYAIKNSVSQRQPPTKRTRLACKQETTHRNN